MHGRAQVALPNQRVLSGHALDISLGGLCILLEDQIPPGVVYPIRFEMVIQGKTNVVMALAKLVYCVFASHGGFRLWFAFTEEYPKRTTLIKSLAGKATVAGAASKETGAKADS